MAEDSNTGYGFRGGARLCVLIDPAEKAIVPLHGEDGRVTLEELQGLIDGSVEAVPVRFPGGDTLYVDEAGSLKAEWPTTGWRLDGKALRAAGAVPLSPLPPYFIGRGALVGRWRKGAHRPRKLTGEALRAMVLFSGSRLVLGDGRISFEDGYPLDWPV